jgi:hypothetical protein
MTEVEAGATVSPGVIDSSGQRVSCTVARGTKGSAYKVTVRCAADDGQHLEHDVIVPIREQN